MDIFDNVKPYETGKLSQSMYKQFGQSLDKTEKESIVDIIQFERDGWIYCGGENGCWKEQEVSNGIMSVRNIVPITKEEFESVYNSK